MQIKLFNNAEILFTKASGRYEYLIDNIIDINKKLLHLNNTPQDSNLLRIYFSISYRYDNKVSNLLKHWLKDMRTYYVEIKNNCEVKILKGKTKNIELFTKVDSAPKYNPTYIQIESIKGWTVDRKIYKIDLPDGKKVIIDHPQLDGLAKKIIRFVSTINYLQSNPGSVILIDRPGHKYRYQSIDERVDYYTSTFTKDISDFLKHIRNNIESKNARVIQTR